MFTFGVNSTNLGEWGGRHAGIERWRGGYSPCHSGAVLEGLGHLFRSWGRASTLDVCKGSGPRHSGAVLEDPRVIPQSSALACPRYATANWLTTSDL